MTARTHRASTVSTAYESLVHCTSIPNIPLPTLRRFFFPKRLVRRHNLLFLYYVKDDVITLKTNQKMPVGKLEIITFYFFE